MRSKKAIYNVTSSILLQLITIVYGFIVPKIIISNFGSDVNGLISSITQFLAYIALLESGFGPVIKSLLYKPIAKKNKNDIEKILKASEKIFRTIAFLFLIYIVVLIIVYPIIINNEFDYLYTVLLIVIISISTFAQYYFGMTYKLYLQSEQESYIISLIQTFTYILAIVFVIILVKFNSSIHLIKLFSGLIFVLRPLLQNHYVKKKFNINLSNVDSNYKIKNKWDGLAQHIAAVIHSNTDVTLLTIFTTLIDVSIYSVYFLVVSGIKSLIQAFSSGIDAGFGNMIANNEIDNLNKKFNTYEVIYFTIAVILFCCTMILIVPFVSVYTKDIVDANYINYTFGYLIVISEYIWSIRLPYVTLTLAAGHFKETRKGAWVEAISNIVISTVLVKKYGLVGVTIGTIVAMTIRTIEFVYHSNKYILKRPIWKSIQKILVVIVETLIIVFICRYLPFIENINYLNWIINALMVFAVSCIVTMTINFIFYRNEFKEMFKILNGVIKRKK